MSVEGTTRNRAEPNRVEEDLREAMRVANEEKVRFEGILSAIGEGISVQDTEFRVLYQNQAHRELVGGHVGEFCYAGYLKRDRVCDGCHLEMAFRDGKIHRIEKVVPTETGVGYVEITAYPLLDASGKPVAGIEVVRDITNQRRAEEELHKIVALIENSADLIGMATMDGKLLYLNGAGRRMVGLDGPEEVRSTRMSDYLFAEDLPEFREKVLGEVERAENWTGEFRLRHFRTGHAIPVELNAFHIRDVQTGKPIHWAAVCRDITERKRMEDEIFRARKLDSLGVLAGGIAHDFNNLLTAIQGNVALAKMHVDPQGKAHQRLEEAEKASRRAQTLTQQLLTFSKGGAPVRKSALVGELIEESASFAVRGSNVRCEFELPGDLWPVDVDVGQFSQVVNNLIINADQAMPKGGTIRVSAANAEIGDRDGLPVKNGKYVRISVTDQGIGIPREYLGRIFDPYFTTKRKGSGLGLATVYSIVKKHDGCIAVRSEPGTGTTFEFHLPASRSRPADPPAVEGHPCGEGRILLMDDEEMIRTVTEEMLKSLGYEVVATSDGEEAIRAYRKAAEEGNPFRAVITDLTVPGGMGGLETLRNLAAFDPEVRAIVYSGYSNDPVMSDYSRYGFRGRITKPFPMAELGRVLREVLAEG